MIMHYAGDCKHPDARNLGEPNITQCWFMPNIGNAWKQPGSTPPSDHDSRLVDMVVLELMDDDEEESDDGFYYCIVFAV